MSESIEDRVIEIDNRSRETQTEVEQIREGLTQLQNAMGQLQMGMQQIYIQVFTQQIMNEVMPRYLAGYEPGDYTKECEEVASKDVNDPVDLRMLVKDPAFSEERYKALCKEVAQVLINMRAQAAMKSQAEAQGEGAPAAKPSAKIVQMPTRKIIKP